MRNMRSRPNRPAAALQVALRIERLDHRTPIRPRHDFLHLGQECIAPARLAVRFEGAIQIAC
jgi:hypothetical protein